MAKKDLNLPEELAKCKSEDEVRDTFCKYFKYKLNTVGRADLYTPQILFEFKYDKRLTSVSNRAPVIAQTLYYIRRYKYGTDDLVIPPIICIVDKNEAFFTETAQYKRFYDDDSFDWDRAASTPDPNLVSAIAKHKTTKEIHVYDFTVEEEFANFCTQRSQLSCEQLQLDFSGFDKKVITEQNFNNAFNLWVHLFGDYVRNGRKESEYFISDIQQGRSFVLPAKDEVVFEITSGNMVKKPMPMNEYQHYWNVYSKCESMRTVHGIMQRIDRLTNEDFRRFTGEFYTPIEFATKGLEYIERVVGKEWWKKGYRLWDMAAGTGNLIYGLPEEALPYCYLSTLLKEDADYCSRLFPAATVFQYDYLNDDVNLFFKSQQDLVAAGATPRMPLSLLNDINNPDIKWIILINPPFATANVDTRIDSVNKDEVSMTQVRDRMTQDDDLGEASRELSSQFIWRISKEFGGKTAFLGMFSKIKYINSNNDSKLREKRFHFKYEKGFCFSSVNFSGTKGKFPVGFLVWNLKESISLSDQKIVVDIFNNDVEKIGTKEIPSIERSEQMNKWFKRPRNTSVLPPFSSALNVAPLRKDTRDRAADNFLASLMCNGNDFYHQNLTALFSGPGCSAGAFSVTPDNFEKALVMHAVRRIPKKTWFNDKDQFLAPTTNNLSEDFVSNCIVWSLFSNSNETVSLKDIEYKGKTYQIKNEMFPFLREVIKEWKCSLSTLELSLIGSTDNRFAAKYLSKHELTQEANEVLERAKKVYKIFYENSSSLHWPKFKISNWDCGWYQIRGALKAAGIGLEEIEALAAANRNLRLKILPDIYKFGFLNGKEHLYIDEEQAVAIEA